MRKFLIAAILAAGPAIASTEMVAQQGDDTVRIMDLPCPYGSVLRFIEEGKRKDFRKADTRIGGKRYFACWTIEGPWIHMIYEDGDQGVVPVGDFKESPGV